MHTHIWKGPETNQQWCKSKSRQSAREKQRSGRLPLTNELNFPKVHFSSELTHVSLGIDSAFLINTFLSSLPSVSLSNFFSKQTRTVAQTFAAGPHSVVVKIWHSNCHGQGLIPISLPVAAHCYLSEIKPTESSAGRENQAWRLHF